MSVSSPPLEPPEFSRVLLVDGTQVETVDSDIVEWSEASKFRGASQYAIYGWARWTEIAIRETQHSLFRVTTNTPSNQGNADSSGDRTLACFITTDSLRFSTYSFQEQGGDDWNIIKDIPFGEDLNSWFFVYFGYDKSLQRAKAWVKFATREAEAIFSDVFQATPKYFSAYVGRDRFYPGFSGELKNWLFAVGEGAFQEGDYDVLFNEDIDKGDNILYESITNVVQDDEHVISTLYQDEVPVD